MSKGNALVALAALWLLGASPARAEWRRAESPNFIVYGAVSEAALQEKILQLEDFDQLLRSVTSVDAEPAPSKLQVYLVSGKRELRTVRPGIGDDVAGFYMATPEGIAAFVNSRTPLARNEVLYHEYVHHFMLQYAPGVYPRWYSEGFAEYFMTAKFQPQKIEFGNYSPARVQSLFSGRWLSMEKVLFGDGQDLKRDDLARFYSQSWLTVHYFLSDSERKQALRRYLGAIARGEDRRTAFESQTGLDAERLEARLKAYVNGRISYLRVTRSSVGSRPPISVTTLPRSANDLMLYQAALRVGLEDDYRDSHVAAIREATARHGEDPFARRVLAHAEARYGDPAAADQILDVLLAADPDDVELLYLKGLRHFTAAENGPDWDAQTRAARPWFARAHRVDPNHFQSLYRYARSFVRDESYTSENNANVLLLAHQLAPQVARLRAAAGWVLVKRGEYERAEAVLMPLAVDSHDPAMAEWATRYIEQARAQAPSDDVEGSSDLASGESPPE